ncbi:RICIN domain-containing protein [Kitasatospora sp. NPDC093806]|uniref:RICIN domain-containing protein n=1 Tax=Kitasatospora sp. NPDC093806 TaxID=3155075 RepID=UPI00343357D1
MATRPHPHPRSHARRLGAALGGLATAAALVLASPGTAQALPENFIRVSPPFELRNDATGKCLEVADWRRDEGAPVRQWTCTGGDNQKWFSTNYGDLRNLHSHRCLDIPRASTVWGTQAVQWGCNFGANQRWSFDPHRGSFRAGHSWNLLLDLAGSSPRDGAPVIQWGDNGGTNQEWTGYQPPTDKG